MMMRFSPVGHAAVAAAAVTVGAVVWTTEAGAETRPGEVADLVERVSPAVVTILARQNAGATPERGSPFGPGSPFEEFFRRFGPPGGGPMPHGGSPEGRQAVGLGSGFVLDDEGHVVTNNHVVDDAAEVTVRLGDDREFTAEVIGVDPETDLALLKVSAEDLPHVTLGDSDALRVGEDVIAVGNPFGLGGTVTRGIVSALARDISAGPYVDFIQTDAAINRGNSGGPLFNMDGEVVGVNSAIYSPNGGSVGVGFAIPSNTVEMVVAQLLEHGSVERGWLGVSIQSVTPDLAAALGLDAPRGALVSQVVDGSPSEGALRPGDVIQAFNGKPVEDSRDLPKLVSAARAGETAKVGVLRDGDETTVSIEIGRFERERIAAADLGEDAPEAAAGRIGATLAPLTRQARAELGLGQDVQGAVVTSLRDGGPAATAGLQVGDVILRVGGQEVASPQEAEEALGAVDGAAALIQIARGGARLFVGVPLA